MERTYAGGYMIIYFSATGNTRLVAEELARLLGDEALDLAPRIRAKDCSEIHSDKVLVVCSPVHVSGLPKFYADYLKKVVFTGSADVYGIFTNAGYSGIAGAQLKSIFRAKGMNFMGFSEFKFPGIHITSITHRPISDELYRFLGHGAPRSVRSTPTSSAPSRRTSSSSTSTASTASAACA